MTSGGRQLLEPFLGEECLPFSCTAYTINDCFLLILPLKHAHASTCNLSSLQPAAAGTVGGDVYSSICYFACVFTPGA